MGLVPPEIPDAVARQQAKPEIAASVIETCKGIDDVDDLMRLQKQRGIFFPDVAAQFIRKLTASRNRQLTVIAMNNIVDAFREDGAFTEIDIEVDIPNYRFGMFRLTRRQSGQRL
jgi:hypothetical protein